MIVLETSRSRAVLVWAVCIALWIAGWSTASAVTGNAEWLIVGGAVGGVFLASQALWQAMEWVGRGK